MPWSMKYFLRNLVLAGFVCFSIAYAEDDGNIHRVAADLVVPEIMHGEPAAGKRVATVTEGWEKSDVRHVLYLPTDWEPGRSYPLIVEYPGNGGYRNDLGDTSDGNPESCMLGYGLSAGEGFLWLSLPFVEVSSQGASRNCRQWWGDIEETKRYCITTVKDVCERYGADKSRVVLCGFSRGAIACNYLGLRDDEIAKVWCGFFCHSHYDGVYRWPYPDSDPASALKRLARLAARPQWISHEIDLTKTEEFVRRSGITEVFTLVPIPYPNHSSAWILRDIPERARARQWLHQTITVAGNEHQGD
ncbi:MAG: hypothetical protein KGQ60_11945 [Planctomycetes bacterium]|nr:hypothetical protein [Planctomycetota bacterium]